MIDLNSLTLYQKKINSYIDENVLTFPTQSKINSLFSEVHKYKIIITSGTSQYNSSYVNNVKIIKNNIPLILKSVTNNSATSANVVLTDNSSDYDIDTSCGSTYNGYYISTIFSDTGSWLSASGSGETPVYLNFEMPSLSEIYFYASWNTNSPHYSYRQAESCEIKVLCDDIVILDTNLENLKWCDRIRIIFDEYDKCHTNVINVGSSSH